MWERRPRALCVAWGSCEVGASMRTLFLAIACALSLVPSLAFAQDDDVAKNLPLTSRENILRLERKVQDSPVIADLIARHPGKELVVCLAGCIEGHGAILWQRLTFVATVDGAINADDRPDASLHVPTASQSGDVVCLAGCDGFVGIVVWRGMRLAWIDEQPRKDLTAALDALAMRLAAAADGRDGQLAGSQPRGWVSTQARDALLHGVESRPTDRLALMANAANLHN